MDISRADLGLLLSLDALLAERSVSAAARRLGLSQPALSAQLARLRALFGDTLLVQSGRRMVPTARAEALRGPLRETLEQLRGLVRDGAPFDPATTTATFRVGASDSVHLVLPLAPLVASRAPQARLALLGLPPGGGWAALEADELDLVIAVERVTPAGARARRLLEERHVFVQRRGHPRGAAPPTIEEFCALDHVLVSPDGGGFHGVADATLAALGRRRRVALSVPSFLLAVPLLARSDLVGLLPRRLALAFPGVLESFDPPFAIPGFTLFASWHPRRQRDPAHLWLRELVTEAARGG